MHRGRYRKGFQETIQKMLPELHADDASANDKYQELCETYDILSDKKKKRVYDKFGSLGIHVAGLGWLAIRR